MPANDEHSYAWESIGAMLAEQARVHADLPAVIDGDTTLTFAELYALGLRAAGGLQALGVQRGELVAVWAPNGWQWVALAYGIWLRGAVVLPISTRLKALEVGPVLQRTGVRALFSVSECAGHRLLDLLAQEYGSATEAKPFAGLPQLQHVVTFDGAGFTEFLDTAPAPVLPAVAAHELAEVLFTSGTTGQPKGVQLQHGQLLRAYWDWSGIGGLRAGDRYLIVPPFSHGFGINAGIVASAIRGMTMVLIDVFRADAALALIARHGVSVISGPPNLFASLIDQVAVADAVPNSLRVAFIGAATVPVAIMRRAADVLGVRRVINAYGLIEGCVVSMTRADDPEAVISTSVGRALPGVEIRVVDEHDTTPAVGERGEIQVRGYGVMPGYWQDPETTRRTITAEGWLRTGDVGELDASGNLRIVDRKKDMYICGGFNAYPAEIENLLLRIDDVSMVAVVGVPDPDKGEIGVAFVVPAGAAALSAAAVIAWARQHMANYKVPKAVFIRTGLPLNANGKVMKDCLREEAIRCLSSACEAQ